MHPIYRTDVPLLPRILFTYIQSPNIFNYFFRLSLAIFVYSSTKCRVFPNVTHLGSKNIHILHKWCAKLCMSSSRTKGLKTRRCCCKSAPDPTVAREDGRKHCLASDGTLFGQQHYRGRRRRSGHFFRFGGSARCINSF